MKIFSSALGGFLHECGVAHLKPNFKTREIDFFAFLLQELDIAQKEFFCAGGIIKVGGELPGIECNAGILSALLHGAVERGERLCSFAEALLDAARNQQHKTVVGVALEILT